MTAAETPVDRHDERLDAALTLPFWQRASVLGTGFGIAAGPSDLQVAIARARHSGAVLVAETSVKDFRTRPAVEWGSELLAFLAKAGESRLAATLLLPRAEVIVRVLTLPGVANKDAENAIGLQIDTLHPWGDEEVAWGWSRAGAHHVLVGLIQKTVLDSYATLFSEAGIALAAVTFSTAAVYSAIRMWNVPRAALLLFNTDGHGQTEVYGESEGRGVYSAEFSFGAERALAFSRAELRLASTYPASAFADVLPTPVRGGSAASALAWAAALAGSNSRRAGFANLLPVDHRASHDRVQYLVPALLSAILVCALIAVFLIFPMIEQKRYREDLDRESRKLEPVALRAQKLDRQIAANRNKTAMLDGIRRRPQSDLEVLNELTRLLPTQAWTNVIEIYPDSVVISGEADQAAPLLKILDSSALFQNSEFSSSVAHSKDSEQFRIRTMRRGRTGRTTP